MNIEALASIFTIIDGELKVLLIRKKTEPYKGYWLLPNALLDKDQTLEQAVEDILSNLGLSDLEYEQCDTFSALDRNPSKRIIGISFLSILDYTTAKLRQVTSEEGIEWFPIDTLPKIGYDHAEVIASAVSVLKEKICQIYNLRKIFPSDFTLPEIQKMYEQILGRELDRRNFRKKFVKAGLVEETGDKTTGTNGRPAKLYRFKENVENKLLF